MRAIVCKAEANLLSAMLHLFQESMVGFVKAGFKIRKGLFTFYYFNYYHLKGYTSYTLAWKEFEKLTTKETAHQYDKSTITGVHFGYGTMNLSIASLPAKILNFISFLGFKGDSKKGFELLYLSFKGNGVRSGMASLVMLIMYQLQLSFAPHIYGDELIEKCRLLVNECLERYPLSALHLYMAARLERASRNILVSQKYFQRCSDAQDHWKELNYLCSYELGMNDCFMLNWENAAKHMEKLYLASYWSQGFYAYFYAACLDMLSQTHTLASIQQRKEWKGKN